MIAEIIFGAVLGVLATALLIVWSLFGAYGVIQMRAQWRKPRTELREKFPQGETVASCPDCGCISVMSGVRCQLCTDIAKAVWDSRKPENPQVISDSGEIIGWIDEVSRRSRS